MKQILLCLILCFLCFYCFAIPQEIIEKSDTNIIEKKINEWADSLISRDFIKDEESFKKESKKLIKDIGDYLKRS